MAPVNIDRLHLTVGTAAHPVVLAALLALQPALDDIYKVAAKITAD